MALKRGVIEKEMENREVFRPQTAPVEAVRTINPMTRTGRPRKVGVRGGIMGRPNSPNYDDFIKVMISKQDKRNLEAHCRQIGSDLSSKVRELIFKYMSANGLK